MSKLLTSSRALIIICVIAVAWLENARHVRPNLRPNFDQPEPSSPPAPQHVAQYGFVVSRFGGAKFSNLDLDQIASAPSYLRGNDSFYLTDERQRIISYVAMGVDQRPYFANSYLVGFMPFQTDQIWVPLATLSMRKRYQLDHVQYGPSMADVWQNSEQAYYYGHGDCEDHALLLADWLIGLGYEARVVIGEVPDGGHAWVVVFLNGLEYVLEATDKRRPSSINDFMLARRATDYRPKLQFDRRHFWENTGSTMTVNYRDNKWQIHSRFTHQAQLN